MFTLTMRDDVLRDENLTLRGALHRAIPNGMLSPNEVKIMKITVAIAIVLIIAVGARIALYWCLESRGEL